MDSSNNYKKNCDYELIIIGAGPAGLSAAKTAAERGVNVILIDENDRPGGQLFTQTHKFFGSKEHYAGIRGFQIGEKLLKDLAEINVKLLLNTTVFGIFPTEKRVMYSTNNSKIHTIMSENILIATGALEKPILFKGWTLPGVMGAGAAQTMMNVYRVLPGKRVIMIGSGNVGLIVSYQLMQAGSKVLGVIELLPKISGYKVHAAKIRRAGVPILTSHTIIEAKGKNFVKSAVISRINFNNGSIEYIKGSEFEINCDLICIASGFQPFSELCWQLGLEMKYISALGGFVPVHNIYMESSIPGIFVAGDVAGIEEASTAMEEGKLVGEVVAFRLGYSKEKDFKIYFNQINKRLSDLRSGSFGIERKKGKSILTNYS